MPTAKQFRDYMLGEITTWQKGGSKLENDIAGHLYMFVKNSYKEFTKAHSDGKKAKE